MSLPYVAPLADQLFALETSGDLERLLALPAFDGIDADLVEAVLTESGRLASEVFAPLNAAGDTAGARWTPEGVGAPPGFARAHDLYRDGGWSGLTVPVERGGQGLPFAVGSLVHEQLSAANMALALCMMLSQGAIAALCAHGSGEQQSAYLAPLVSGVWTGAMNLTEPQAGSDVGQIRASARPDGEGGYWLDGTKIFISWGEHDLAENIVHLVLARLPGAPPGTKGLSLFVTSRHHPTPSGELGVSNDIRCLSLEHKLGIRGSPTCTLRFGEDGACRAFLVGAENDGMAAMFTMMNHARLGVAFQGVAVAERAWQAAAAFAQERIQGRPVDAAEGRAIIAHPDVRRTLMAMRALTQAARAVCLFAAGAVDLAHAGPDEHERVRAKARADLMTPIAKAWATEVGLEVTDLALKVFGGMGYVEETGVAQLLRDARIAPIYEGTNGVQAADLVSRKIVRNGGAAFADLVEDLQYDAAVAVASESLADLRDPLLNALSSLKAAGMAMLDQAPRDALAASTPLLNAVALTVGAGLLLRQALKAEALLKQGQGDLDFLTAKVATARFYFDQILPRVAMHLAGTQDAGAMVFSLTDVQLVT